MAPAKTVIALFLSMQGAHAVRSEADAASLLTEASGAKAQFQQVLEKLQGDPCEYATGHAVKTLGLNIAGGVNALQEVQTKINELADACKKIAKAEANIAKYQASITEIDQRVPATTGSMSKTNEEISQYKSQHPDITDEACKAAYAQTGIGGKTKRAFKSMTGGVSNFFKNIGKSKEVKEANKKAADDAKAAATEKLASDTDTSNKCKELDGLEDTLEKAQKSLDKDAKTKVSTEEKLEKEKAELVEASAAKDVAKTGAVQAITKISDEIIANLGSESSAAAPETIETH